MYKINDKTYAEAFKFLKHKSLPIIALGVSSDHADDYDEYDMESPFVIGTLGDYYTYQCGFCLIKPKSFDYPALKAQIINMRYSNNDQIAIMLNDQAGTSEAYQKMQSWRYFAKDLAKAIIAKHIELTTAADESNE
jgi:hypothetical protein